MTTDTTGAAKEPELPAAYYTHKRTSLLASGALLVLSIATSKASPTLSFEGVSVPIGGDVTLFILAATAAYYCGYFYVMWRTDSAAYIRAKSGQHPQLERALDVALANLQQSLGELRQTAATFRLSNERMLVDQVLPHLVEAVGAEEVNRILSGSDVFVVDVVGSRSELEHDLRKNVDGVDQRTFARLLDMFERHLGRAWTTAATRLLARGKATYEPPPAERDLEDIAVGAERFDKQAETLEVTTSQVERIRNVLVGAKREILFRLAGLDLVPCFALCAIALAHYLGRYYPIIHFTVADIPKLLGLVAK